MIELYCVRAEFGKYTEHFLKGNYIAIGWLPNTDLTNINVREELYPIYKKEYPSDTSNVVIGQQVGQIGRFLLEIKAGDYIITPSSDTEYIYYGVIEDDPSYYFTDGVDGCPFFHRRKIKWDKIRNNGSTIPNYVIIMPVKNNTPATSTYAPPPTPTPAAP